jgi:molybdopterin-synthase adenylyltransferase
MVAEILAAMAPLVAESRAPDGSVRRTLSLAHTRQLSAAFDVTHHQIEIVGLTNDIVPTRYLRNMNSFSATDQIRLLRSQAAVVGLGGLGGMVIEILARAGVGHLVLIDGDRFEEHNLNRQMLCLQESIGSTKAQRAAERVQAINSSVGITVQPLFLTDENALDLIGESQVVVDCLDNIHSRFMLQTASQRAGIALVSAAVAGTTGHVTTIFAQDVGLERIHGPRHSLANTHGAEIILGNLPQTVTMVAAMESAEALKILTGRTQQLLRDKLWVMDLSDNTFEVISLV